MRLEQSMLTVRPDLPPQTYNLAEQGLWDANNECYKLAEEFSRALQDLQVSGKHRRWESFRQAFKTVWSEEKVESLYKRLSNAREQLMIHLLVHMR